MLDEEEVKAYEKIINLLRSIREDLKDANDKMDYMIDELKNELE